MKKIRKLGMIIATAILLSGCGNSNNSIISTSESITSNSEPVTVSQTSPTEDKALIDTTTTTTTTTAKTTVATKVPEIDKTIPVNLRANNFGERQQIQVNWNAVDDAEQYLVSVFAGTELIRTEKVSEPKCVVTGLEDGKQYTFKVQAYVNNKLSDFSEEIKEKTISRQDVIHKVLNDYIRSQKEEESNKIKPVFGTGDIFCTIGDYEIHIKKEESFSGDTTSLGVYNKSDKEWIIPYTTDSKFITEPCIDVDEFMKQRTAGTNTTQDYYSKSTLIYEGDTVISCNDYISTFWNYQWFYDFYNDKLLCMYRTVGDWEYLYSTSDELFLYDSSSVTAVNWESGEERDVIEGYIKAILSDSILVKIDEDRYSSKDDHLALVNYKGDILIDLSEYEPYSYSGSPHDTSYNGKQLLTVMKGQDSGIYACLINSDASLAFEPIKLYKPDNNYSNKDLLYLFDDFFVIIRQTDGDPEQGMYFYELDGSQIMRLNLE